MSPARKRTLTSAIVTFFCLAGLSRPNAVSAYNAADDFSIRANPNGVWTYGWTAGLGTTFHADTSSTNSYEGSFPGVEAWLGNQDGRADGIPYVVFNRSNTKYTNNHYTVWQHGVLALQPGAEGEYAVVRWTAPSSGQVTISATFSGLSALGDSSDVHVLLNGVPAFSSDVNGSPSPASYSITTNVLAGDTIDFASGVGRDGSPNEDNTALSATITATPPLCPNIMGTWTGQVNVVNARTGYSTTRLSIQVTDQDTNGCLVRGYLRHDNPRRLFPDLRDGHRPSPIPFTGTISDRTTLLLNVGGDGGGKASATLDLNQAPPSLTRFTYQSGNGDTLAGTLTLRPSPR